ncbi:hypothetical protein Tco_1261691 [Tanacetum coccineum]
MLLSFSACYLHFLQVCCFPLLCIIFSLARSKRNLASITCSATQIELLGFVEVYGIPMYYDPQLTSFEQTPIDASEGYIPLYLSLFSIGNLRLPFNIFCLDVFKFFKCHFPLLNLFGVARVTTFAVACKAFDVVIPQILNSSMTNIQNWKSEFIFMKKTLVSKAFPALITDFRHGVGTFAFPYHTEPFDEVLRDCLVRHPFAAQTFVEPILYLAGLANSWEHARMLPRYLSMGRMSFRNFMKRPRQTPTFSARPAEETIDVGSPSIEYSKAVNLPCGVSKPRGMVNLLYVIKSPQSSMPIVCNVVACGETWFICGLSYSD